MEQRWTSVWGNAMSVAENRPESYAKDITLRYRIAVPFGGSRLRLTLDNYCGTESVTVTGVTVLHNGRIWPVRFRDRRAGQTAEPVLYAFMPAGENIVSEELELPVERGDSLEVNLYFGEFTKMRSLVYAQGLLCKGAFAMGNFLQHAGELPMDCSRPTNLFYFLSNVSVLAGENCRAVVCYGDSITAQNWPDEMQLKLQEDGVDNVSVIRRATSGSRILREYSCITYESYGLMGTKRFCHEVPTDGADTVIIQQGINDIIHPVGTDVNPFRPMSDLPSAEELIEGLKWYIEQARRMGLSVYLGTLLPIEGWRTYAPFREELKNAFNEFIRTTDLIDGVIDFDKCLRDPDHPSRFLPEYDSGDHLHPSAAGYRRMGEEAARVMEMRKQPEL